MLKKICIQAYRRGFVYDSSTTFAYSIAFNTSAYNPGGNWYEAIIFRFQDPFFTFIIGIVVAICLGYFFYKKSIKNKTITYNEIADIVIINENIDDLKAMPIIVEGEKLYKACLFKFSLQNSSEVRIEGSYIQERIEVELLNMVKIIDLKTNVRGKGWKNIEKISNNKIAVDINFIDSIDKVDVKVIGEISANYYPKGIILIVHGKVAEVRIKEEVDKTVKVLDSIFFAFGLASWLLIILYKLAELFKFSIPPTVRHMISSVFDVGIFFLIFYIILTKNGRRSIVYSFKFLKNSLAKIFA